MYSSVAFSAFTVLSTIIAIHFLDFFIIPNKNSIQQRCLSRKITQSVKKIDQFAVDN